jgi:hypothetical protein
VRATVYRETKSYVERPFDRLRMSGRLNIIPFVVSPSNHRFRVGDFHQRYDLRGPSTGLRTNGGDHPVI